MKRVRLRRWLGLCACTLTVVFAEAPVAFESRVDSRGSGQAVIRNLKAVPLTAYLIQIFLEPCLPTPQPPVFRASDAALTPHGEALSPLQSRTETLGVSHCNKVGSSVPGRAELRAVIFDDGSTWGESKWVQALLENRKLQLQELEMVIRQLNAGVPRRDIVAGLDRRLPALESERNLPFPPVLDLRELLSKTWSGNGDPLPVLQRLRNKLLEAKPPLR